MRNAFTLIELLVVLIIITATMGVVIPKGSKILNGFQQTLQFTKDKQKVSKIRSLSFLKATETTIDIQGVIYHISQKGILTQHEKSNHND